MWFNGKLISTTNCFITELLNSFSIFSISIFNLFYFLPLEVICTLVWSLGLSATADTGFSPTSPQRANAKWTAPATQASCAEEPAGCLSSGWSWARNLPGGVSFMRRNSQNATYTSHTQHRGLRRGRCYRRNRQVSACHLIHTCTGLAVWSSLSLSQIFSPSRGANHPDRW